MDLAAGTVAVEGVSNSIIQLGQVSCTRDQRQLGPKVIRGTRNS